MFYKRWTLRQGHSLRARIRLQIRVAQDVTQNQPENSQRCNRDAAAKSELGSVNEAVATEKRRLVTVVS